MLFFRILTILAVAFVLANCSREPVVTISNLSPVVIMNIVVSGSGFSERIDSLAAGSERSLILHPSGESGVRIAFDAGGQHIDSGEQGYVEANGGYRVAVRIERDLKVSVLSKLQKY